jgi:recombination protein RecT
MSAPTPNTPAPVTAERKAFQTLNNLLQQSKEQIARALPKHMTPERLIRMAVTAFQRTPALQECSPLSIVGCVIQAGELGLDLSGPLGQAYMVPYFNKHTRQKEAQFQIGYRGLVKLAFNSGKVSYFNAHEVCENDSFYFEQGTSQRLVHRPVLVGRGEVIAYYSVIRMKDGASDFEVLSLEDVRKHRDRYSKSADRADSPWQTAFDEMAKKTVIRRLAKRAPVSAELQTAASLDEMAEVGVQQPLAIGLESPAALPGPPVGNHSLRAPKNPEPQPYEAEPIDADYEVDGKPLPDPEPLAPAPGGSPAPATSPTETILKAAVANAEQQKAPSDEDQMALRDFVAEMTDRIKAAERSIHIGEIKTEIGAATWVPSHVRQELLTACDQRNAALAPKKQRGQF